MLTGPPVTGFPMFSVASTLAALRQHLPGVAVVLLALGLLGAGAGHSELHHPGLSHLLGHPGLQASNSSARPQQGANSERATADRESSSAGSQPPVSERTTAGWLTSIATAEPPGAAPQWRVPPLRPLPAFGDSTWNSAAADQSPAVTLTRRRRDQGESTRRLALLWASLQAWKVRLQI